MRGSRVSGRGSRGTILVAILLGCAGRVEGQGVRREFGVEAYALRATPDRVGGALYLAQRLGSRARLSLLGGVDGSDGGTAGRFEGLIHFLLAPDRKKGAGLYIAGGLAADIADRTDARVVALVGVEGVPGARSGWMLEGGVGGGWRFAAGWRWRH